jgi:hypothetical protein
MRSDIGLPDIPCIYIPKEELAVQRTVGDFIEELEGWTHAKLEYQRFSRHIGDAPCRVNGQKKRKTSGHMSVKDFCARVHQRRNTESAQRLSVPNLPPYNILDISGCKLVGRGCSIEMMSIVFYLWMCPRCGYIHGVVD